MHLVDNFQRLEIMKALQYEGVATLQMGQVTFRSIHCHDATALGAQSANITRAKALSKRGREQYRSSLTSSFMTVKTKAAKVLF